MRVLDIQLESVSPGVWFNHHHKIQLDSLETYHDQDCDLRITKTTTNDIFLIQYMYSQISRVMNLNYKSLDPLCDRVRSNPLSSTIRVDNNVFVQNVGDASVKFECKLIQIAPSPDGSTCYIMFPVQEFNYRIPMKYYFNKR